MTRAEFEALVIRHLRDIGAAYQGLYPNSPHALNMAVDVEKKDAFCWAFNAHWRCDNDFPVDILAPTFGGEEDEKEEPCQVQMTAPNEEPWKSSPVLYQKHKRPATPRPMRFAQNIKALREARGLSVRDLAYDLKTSTNAVWCWENKDQIPTLKTLCRLSECFGYTLDDLVYANLEEEEQV